MASTMYERVGGEPFFKSLVDRFYTGVVSDPVLRPLYPEDLGAPSEHLRLFLVQYWGGPRSYSELRGHPRLRMRHAPFAIGLAERDAWLRLMLSALAEAALEKGLDHDDEAEMAEYFRAAATQLINQAGRRTH
jgi:hemoglobin